MPLRRRGAAFRRRPGRRAPLPHAAGAVRFERLVERALGQLPASVRPLLQNVAIVIDDEPSPDQLARDDLEPGDGLYGLYEGTPATEYGAGEVPFPNKITLFRLPLEEDFPDPDELAAEVRRTVLHELAHHAGIADERLHGLDVE